MRENMFLAYTSYCPENLIKNWNCYWCRKSAGKITVSDYIIHSTDKAVAGYVGYNDKNIFVIFRGTKLLSIETWITNLRATREKDWPENVPGSHVHKGFFEAYSDISEKVLEAVRKLAPQGKRILILGHSRGGSLGALAAVHLSRNGFQGKIDFMAYGMARVGNEAFSNYFNTIIPNSLRVVNQKDVVSRLPPTLLKYKHVLREAWFEKGPDQFKLCSATNSEDPSCSKGVLIPWVTDHFMYFGFDFRDGKREECD